MIAERLRGSAGREPSLAHYAFGMPCPGFQLGDAQFGKLRLNVRVPRTPIKEQCTGGVGGKDSFVQQAGLIFGNDANQLRLRSAGGHLLTQCLPDHFAGYFLRPAHPEIFLFQLGAGCRI
jgi:hypothetical protein